MTARPAAATVRKPAKRATVRTQSPRVELAGAAPPAGDATLTQLSAMLDEMYAHALRMRDSSRKRLLSLS